LVEGVEQFCSVDCFLKYVGNLPVFDGECEPICKSPFVSENFEIWDAVTGAYYRSWFEVHVARCLQAERIEFAYETQCIFIRRGHYTPDFWLPLYATYIEVKGYWGVSGKKKYRDALKMGKNVILLPWHLASDFRKRYGETNERNSIVR
jgi:hypothetical protein